MDNLNQEIAYCRHYLNECAKNKKWREGAIFVRSLPKTLKAIRKSWLAKHILNCAKAESELYKLFSTREGLQQRLEKLRELAGLTLSPNGTSRPLTGGKISIALYRHDVQGSEKKFALIEKVYHAEHADNFQRETALMAEVDAEVLRAPPYYGSQQVGPFLCTYYQHLNAQHPREDEFLSMRPELVAKLWRVQPGESLRNNNLTNVDLSVERFFSANIIEQLAKPFQSKLLRWSVNPVEKRLQNALARVKQLPLFVMHGDLSKGNVLVRKRDQQLFLIDWDKWSLKRVGVGLGSKGLQLDQSLRDFIAEHVPNLSGVTEESLWSAMLLDSIYTAHEPERRQLMAAWFEFFERNKIDV